MMEENVFVRPEKMRPSFSFVAAPELEALPCELLVHSEGRKEERQRHIRPCAVTAGKVDEGPGSRQKMSRIKQCPENAARERSRVRTLRRAFLTLQAALPSVPPDTKLSKLDVLVLATSYIAHLTQTLDQGRQLPERVQSPRASSYLHPMKKWPMRSNLYAEAMGDFLSRAPGTGNEQEGVSKRRSWETQFA